MQDIESGSRWQAELAGELEDTNYGVVCTTRENLTTPWLSFEAGALAKTVQSARLVPLAVDLEIAEITGPLAQFQAQRADKDGIRAIMASINATNSEPLGEALLEKAFEKWWPDLEKGLQEIAKTPAKEKATDGPSERQLLEEVLNTVRAIARERPSEALTRKPWANPNRLEDFTVGRKVVHAAFGEGVVSECEPDGVVMVRFFNDGSERKLMAEYAPLALLADK
jgi:hypothetical protein